MAKTDFANGTIVQPDFLDSMYLTGGGHVHDGADNDGHSSKVNLSNGAHVTGTLPEDMVAAHVHDGGSGTGHRSKVQLTQALEVQGYLPWANVCTPERGALFTVQLIENPFYDTRTVIASGWGQWAKWGNIISIRLPRLIATSQYPNNAYCLDVPSRSWPSDIVPYFETYLPILCVNGLGGSSWGVCPGMVIIPDSGSFSWQILVGPYTHASVADHALSSANWIGNTNVGVINQSITYEIV